MKDIVQFMSSWLNNVPVFGMDQFGVFYEQTDTQRKEKKYNKFPKKERGKSNEQHPHDVF